MSEIWRIPGGPRWVRWGEFAGKTEWLFCIDVAITDGWLVLQPAEGPDLLIPQHVIRGHVEASETDPRADV